MTNPVDRYGNIWEGGVDHDCAVWFLGAINGRKESSLHWEDDSEATSFMTNDGMWDELPWVMV